MGCGPIRHRALEIEPEMITNRLNIYLSSVEKTLIENIEQFLNGTKMAPT